MKKITYTINTKTLPISEEEERFGRIAHSLLSACFPRWTEFLYKHHDQSVLPIPIYYAMKRIGLIERSSSGRTSLPGEIAKTHIAALSLSYELPQEAFFEIETTGQIRCWNIWLGSQIVKGGCIDSWNKSMGEFNAQNIALEELGKFKSPGGNQLRSSDLFTPSKNFKQNLVSSPHDTLSKVMEWAQMLSKKPYSILLNEGVPLLVNIECQHIFNFDKSPEDLKRFTSKIIEISKEYPDAFDFIDEIKAVHCEYYSEASAAHKTAIMKKHIDQIEIVGERKRVVL